MLNRFTFKPSTYRTFVMSDSPGREMIPFPLICDLLLSPKVTLPPFLDSKTLKRDRSLVMWLEQPLSRYHKYVSILKCGLHHEAHFVFRWQINGNGIFSHLPFMNKAFNFHSSQMNSILCTFSFWDNLVSSLSSRDLFQ